MDDKIIHPELAASLPDVGKMRWYRPTADDIRAAIDLILAAERFERWFAEAQEHFRHPNRHRGELVP